MHTNICEIDVVKIYLLELFLISFYTFVCGFLLDGIFGMEVC